LSFVIDIGYLFSSLIIYEYNLCIKDVIVYEKVSVYDCSAGYSKLYRPDGGERCGGKIMQSRLLQVM
jgi:hypothetical protein